MKNAKWLGLFFAALLILTAKVNEVNAEVVVGDQIDIYVGPNNQTDQSAAYDSINKRYLAVWHEGVEGTANFYGQLVNNDGSLYGQRITIYQVADYPYLFAPKVAFDPVNQRFLVAWGWSHIRQPEGIWVTEAYGQFVNSDGSLNGGNFRISPDPIEIGILELTPQDITFDAALNRFFVLITSLKYGPHQLYGRFVNADSSLGDFFQITNFASGSGVEVGTAKLGFDSNNGRFLAAYSNLDDGDIYGRLLDSNGGAYTEEFIISDTGQSGGSNAITSLPFDPFNSRFLAVFNMTWWLHKVQGQFVNADGSLYGEAMAIFDLRDSNNNSAVFDPVNNKFLVVATYADTRGQLLNPDGSFFGSSFFVAPLSTYPPILAGDSLNIGTLAVWSVDLGYGTGRDIVGRLIQWKWKRIKAIVYPR